MKTEDVQNQRLLATFIEKREQNSTTVKDPSTNKSGFKRNMSYEEVRTLLLYKDKSYSCQHSSKYFESYMFIFFQKHNTG